MADTQASSTTPALEAKPDKNAQNAQIEQALGSLGYKGKPVTKLDAAFWNSPDGRGVIENLIKQRCIWSRNELFNKYPSEIICLRRIKKH